MRTLLLRFNHKELRAVVRIFALGLLIILFSMPLYSQISFQWSKRYGGTNNDGANDIKPTSDGGFIVVGTVYSHDGDVTGSRGNCDGWVVKLDSHGSIEWSKAAGGSSYDELYKVIVMSDGNYIAAGMTYSSNGDLSSNFGEADYWVVKFSHNGEVLWSKSYGGSKSEFLTDIQPTDDGGCIVIGGTASNDGQVTQRIGRNNIWVVKLSSTGTLEWQKTYGGQGEDYGGSILQISDGSYLFVGTLNSHIYPHIWNAWVVKTNTLGDIEWQKQFPQGIRSGARFVSQSSDGGYEFLGYFNSDSSSVGGYGGQDGWFAKLLPNGEMQWQYPVGTENTDFFNSFIQTTNGRYVLCGQTYNNGHSTPLLVEIDQSGSQKVSTFEGTSYATFNAVSQTLDNNYILVGSNASNDLYFGEPKGQEDFWILKTCANGNPVSTTLTDSVYCSSTTIKATLGFESYLWSTGSTASSINVTKGGTYSVKAKNFSGCFSCAEVNVPDPVGPYEGQQICMVTMDSSNQHCSIVFEKILDVGIDSILVYRMNSQTSQFDRLNSWGINDPPVIVDLTSKPETMSQQYKISIMDSCGQISRLSLPHRTILLQASKGVNNEINLSWNPYIGFDYQNFEIYRRLEGGSFNLIAYVPNNTFAYTDRNIPSGNLMYQIRILKSQACNSTSLTKGSTLGVGLSSFDYSVSNISRINPSDIEEYNSSALRIFPNPANQNLNIQWDFSLNVTSLQVIDCQGRVLSRTEVPSETDKYQLNIEALDPGLYFLVLNDSRFLRFAKI